MNCLVQTVHHNRMRVLTLWCCAICFCYATDKSLRCPTTGHAPIANDKALCAKYDSWASNCGSHYVVGNKCYCWTENRRCESADGSKSFMEGHVVDEAIYKIMSQNDGGNANPNKQWEVNKYGRYFFNNYWREDYHCCLEICNELEGCIAVQTDSTTDTAHWNPPHRKGWCYFIQKCDKWVGWKPGTAHTFGTYYTDKASHHYGAREVLEEEDQEEVTTIVDVEVKNMILSTVYVVVACLFLGIGVYFGSKLPTKPKSIQIN